MARSQGRFGQVQLRNVSMDMGAHERACEAYEEALERYRELGGPLGVASALGNPGV